MQNYKDFAYLQGFRLTFSSAWQRIAFPVRKGGASRLPQEFDNRLHLPSREDLRVGLVTHVHQGIPQAARELHLLAEEAYGTALASVGVIELCQLAEAVTTQGERSPT